MDSAEHGENSSFQNVNTILSISDRETAGDIRKISCSGGSFFVPVGIIEELDLREGMPLQGSALETVEHHHHVYTGYRKALDLLSCRALSEFLLRRKLQLRKFSAAAVDEIVGLLNEKKFLDDAEFAREYLDYLMRKKNFGKPVLTAKLIQQGVSPGLAEEAVSTVPREYLERALEKSARKLLSKKGLSKEKFVASLSRKGFSAAETFKFLEETDFFAK